MTTIATNPPTSELFLQRNPETGNMSIKSDKGVPYLVSGTIHIPFNPRVTGSSMFFNIAHGTEDNDFSTYLGELDQWLETKINAYNTKYSKNLKYETCMQAPMKQGLNGMVVNQEFLDEYGFTTSVRAIKRITGKNSTGYPVHLEHDCRKVTLVNSETFEGLIHKGTRMSCVMRPNLWIKELDNGTSTIQLVPVLVRAKVQASSLDDIALEEPTSNYLASKSERLDL
jgi:hypothetical protein